MKQSTVSNMSFTAKMWRYSGESAWFFVTLPKIKAAKLRKTDLARGWGSIRVIATTGESSWSTSIFPDKKSQSYLLPIKAQMRKKESLKIGSRLKITLEFPDKERL